MDPVVILLAALTCISTMAGGYLAIRLRGLLPYIYSFSAGTMIAVALLHVLPDSVAEAQSQGFPIVWIFFAAVLSFLAYSIVERLFCGGKVMGSIGASTLVLHSFIEGAAIGSAFQLGAPAGLIVAFAVISHDFADGMNIVAVTLKNGHPNRSAKAFLLADGIAPVLGVFASFMLSGGSLLISLGAIAGVLIYISASDLMPETRRYDAGKMILLTVLGVSVIALLTLVL